MTVDGTMGTSHPGPQGPGSQLSQSHAGHTQLRGAGPWALTACRNHPSTTFGPHFMQTYGPREHQSCFLGWRRDTG